jgi:hypothetical protein
MARSWGEEEMTMRLALALAAAFLVCASSPARAREAPGREPYTLELVDEFGRSLPAFEHRGRTWVLGRLDQRYLLRVRNGSGRRIEVVASVDGRDVVDGRTASYEKRGYVIAPWGELTIDGFRLSPDAVAAFRFSSVRDSYAARMGDARAVGVVGAAIFLERRRPVPLPPLARREPAARGEDVRDEATPATSESGSSAQGKSAEAHREARQQPGLGTSFGEEHGSRVEQVAFERESERPAVVLTLRYDDERGLAAQGIDVGEGPWSRGDEAWRRRTARPFPGGFAEPPPGWRR